MWWNFLLKNVIPTRNAWTSSCTNVVSKEVGSLLLFLQMFSGFVKHFKLRWLLFVVVIDHRTQKLWKWPHNLPFNEWNCQDTVHNEQSDCNVGIWLICSSVKGFTFKTTRKKFLKESLSNITRKIKSNDELKTLQWRDKSGDKFGPKLIKFLRSTSR